MFCFSQNFYKGKIKFSKAWRQGEKNQVFLYMVYLVICVFRILKLEIEAQFNY